MVSTAFEISERFPRKFFFASPWLPICRKTNANQSDDNNLIIDIDRYKMSRYLHSKSTIAMLWV